jgi:hypothetical protein
MSTPHPLIETGTDPPTWLNPIIFELSDRLKASGYQDVEAIKLFVRHLQGFGQFLSKQLADHPDRAADIVALQEAMQPLWAALRTPTDPGLWN